MNHRLMRALLAITMLPMCASAVEPRSAPEPESPQPRPETGRDRAMRHRRAQGIAAETGLDVEEVYRALGEGQTEAQIKAAWAANRAKE